MNHPPAASGVEIAQEKKHSRKQPPNQVWLNAIMSKSRSSAPSPSSSYSSAARATPPLHMQTHPYPAAHVPPPKHSHAGAGWHPVRQTPSPPLPPPSFHSAPLPPQMADDRSSHRLSRTPSPAVTASALHALSVEATAVAESRYADQLSLEHDQLEAAILKALKDLVADQNCCFIARGQCHLCGSSNGDNLVPVVNFCPDFCPTHSLCREHLRSMHRVRLVDIFAGKNQPTVSKRALRCTVCALSCPCSSCQVARDIEIGKYKQWLAAPTYSAPFSELPASTQSSDPEMDAFARSDRPQPRERELPSAPSPSVPKDDSRQHEDGWTYNGADEHHREGSVRSGTTEPVEVDHSFDYAEDKLEGAEGVDQRGYYYAEDKHSGGDPGAYDAGLAIPSDHAPMMPPADEKKTVRSRVPKRAAKESVPYPLDTPTNRGNSQRGPSPRERLLGGEATTPALASPSAASVLSCPTSEKSLVNLLSSLNQQITPAVRFFASEEDEPRSRHVSKSSSSYVKEDERHAQVWSDRRNGREDHVGFTGDRPDASTRRQKRKRDGIPSQQSEDLPRENHVDTPLERSTVESDSGSSSYRLKAPAPLSTAEKRPRAQVPPVGSRPPSPSPRSRTGSRAKAPASTPSEPKSSTRKREAPSDPSPLPPTSSRRRKAETPQITRAPSPASQQKTSRGGDHRGHAHKPIKAQRRGQDGRKKKTKRANDDSDEDVRYVPGQDDDDDDLVGEGGGEEEDDELDTNLDYCEVCLAAGDLVCCDVCPRSFHLHCLKMTEDDLPDGEWQCAECKKPSYFESFTVSVAEKTTVPAKCLQIVQCLKSHPFAKQFLMPVENVPHYTAVVKQPMDLTTIEKKILDGKYMVSAKGTMQGGTGATKILHLGSFAEDVRLVWSNCKLFNDDGSGITRAADHLSDGFEKLYQQVVSFVASSTLKDTGQTNREDKKPTHQGEVVEVNSAPKPETPQAKPSVKQTKEAVTGESRSVPDTAVEAAPSHDATASSEPEEVTPKESTTTKESTQDQEKAEDSAANSNVASSTTVTSAVPAAPAPRSTPPSQSAASSSGSLTTSPTDSTTTTFVGTSASLKAVAEPPPSNGAAVPETEKAVNVTDDKSTTTLTTGAQGSRVRAIEAAEEVCQESVV